MREGESIRGAGPDIEPLRPVLKRLIAALRPEEVWLFGSRAENRAREDSDYDLLTVLPDGASTADLDPIAAWEMVRGLGVPVDVVPCTRSEFDEEKREIDTLPRAAYERGVCVFMSIEKRIQAFLTLAEQDLQAADVLAKAGNHYAAYHCQQAVEKLVKSLLIHSGKEAGLEHRLDILIGRLDRDDPFLGELRPLERYTPFATTFRYPTPGGRIPKAPAPDGILADVTTLRSLLARVRSHLLAGT